VGQGRGAVLIAQVRIRPGGQEHLGQILPAVANSQVQGADAPGIETVGIGAAFQQQCGGLGLLQPHRPHEGGHTLLVAGVRVGAFVQQRLEPDHVAGLCQGDYARAKLLPPGGSPPVGSQQLGLLLPVGGNGRGQGRDAALVR